MNIGDKVRYIEPFEDEVSITYTIIEVNGDRVIMQADMNLTINPQYIAMIDEIEVVKE